MTAKQIAGYLKARRDQQRSTLGGITFNDGHNVPTFGITQAQYYAIDRSMNDEYGMNASSNLTSAGVKKALRNHPISERSGTRHHAAKKSPAKKKAGTKKKLSHATKILIPDTGYVIAPHGGEYVQAFRSGRGPLADSDALKKATRAAEALAEKLLMAIDIVRVTARGEDRYIVEEVYPRSWGQESYRADTSRHHAKKKPPAQLQREINEALSRHKPRRFAVGDPNNDAYLRFLDDANDPPRTDLIRAHKDDLIREMDKPARRRAHATRTDGGVDQFWGFFEEELVNSAAKNPGDYALGPDEPPEVYARRVRDKFQSGAEASGLGHINLGTPTWRRVARRLGIAKFSQKALKDVYAAHGGKI